MPHHLNIWNVAWDCIWFLTATTCLLSPVNETATRKGTGQVPKSSRSVRFQPYLRLYKSISWNRLWHWRRLTGPAHRVSLWGTGPGQRGKWRNSLLPSPCKITSFIFCAFAQLHCMYRLAALRWDARWILSAETQVLPSGGCTGAKTPAALLLQKLKICLLWQV